MSNEAHVAASGPAHSGAHDEHPPTTIREYVMIGLVLTVVTAVELWASYNAHILGGTLVPVLLVLSAFKFAVVVAMFMHLRFEHGLLTRLFAFGLVLGAGIIITLSAIFWNDGTDVVGGGKTSVTEPAAAPAAPAPGTTPAR
ncbi:MAG: cytochrome C oxidase subunit IV family protein [Dehalococcoidia bacterium]